MREANVCLCDNKDADQQLRGSPKADKRVCVPSLDNFRWRSGALVRASDFGPRGPLFEPRPVHILLWP